MRETRNKHTLCVCLHRQSVEIKSNKNDNQGPRQQVLAKNTTGYTVEVEATEAGEEKKGKEKKKMK